VRWSGLSGQVPSLPLRRGSDPERGLSLTSVRHTYSPAFKARVATLRSSATTKSYENDYDSNKSKSQAGFSVLEAARKVESIGNYQKL
jgi:hypothetical protein